MWWKGNPRILLVGMLIGAASMENSMGVSQKIKSKTTVWSSRPTLGHIYGKSENTNL